MSDELLHLQEYLKDAKKPTDVSCWFGGANGSDFAKYSIHTLMLLLIVRTKYSDFSDQRHYR